MSSKSGYQLLGLLTQLGLNIITTVGLAGYGGFWLDRRLGTGVLFTGIGVVLGIIAAYYSVYKTLDSFFAEKGGSGHE